MAAFADEMCACKDQACAMAVQARMSTFVRTAPETGPASAEDRQRAHQIGERAGGCMAPLVANAPVVLGTDGLPTTCKDYADEVTRLVRCPLVTQQTKDAVADGYRQRREAFQRVPREKLSQLSFACASWADALRRDKASECP